MPTFDDFLDSFFGIFTQTQFRNGDFLTYLQRPNPRRAGDEASIVDNTIVGPLLALLGYAPGEQVYNRNNKNGRPDFAPTVGEFGVCFVVEDKSTGLDLTLDLSDPESHLSQLTGYLRSLGLRSGWLTNGRRLMVWRTDNPAKPECALDFDVAEAVRQWRDGGAEGISTSTQQALLLLWEQFQKETFTDIQRLEHEIATDLAVWEAQALPLEANETNQDLLVGAVKMLLQDLQADARNRLDTHLARYDDYMRLSNCLADDADTTATVELERLRGTVQSALEQFAPLIGLTEEEAGEIKADLREFQRNPRAFLNTKELLAKTLETINAARERKFTGGKKAVQAWTKYDNGLGTLGKALEVYGDTAFGWHQRQAILRHDNRESIEVQENYAIWTSIVQETMLGGMTEPQRRDEFALQSAYVVFIRLLLIRVCEDKGILPHRFLSNGGLKRWQEDIERYFIFSTGNPYDTLLDMAFQNAQNIYAHFFTGRELFNWYSLTRLRFIRVLHQLSRFNFAGVDSDLIGTIYSTYVGRPEKKQKGQYYTPPEIVRYILDESGYVSGPAIIGSNKRLIDPACGSGTFLVEAARRLVAAYGKSGSDNPRQLLESVRNNLFGFDLNPFACYLAEVNLLIQVLDLVKLAIDGKNPPRLQRFHIYNVDALSPASGVLYYARANTLMAEELDVVDRIKDRKDEYATGFGWVVANPPYGAKLTEDYKGHLRQWWPAVFYGKPDTYVFFFALGLRLLDDNGRLGFITPNTYLMGTNTAAMRGQLLGAGRITQIVDLPQGIWKDANVDCALLFLTNDANAEARKAQQTVVNSMGVRDTLDKLTARAWNETLTQLQAVWMADTHNDFNIRLTPLVQQIEEACRISSGSGTSTIQRLGDVTESSRGLEPYHNSEQGRNSIYVKPKLNLASYEQHWKPLVDSRSYIGRYEFRWSKLRPHLNYGDWLYRAYETKYFERPKIIVIRFRNRALKRRLIGAYDESGLYVRENYSVLNEKDERYRIKYLLALFNSSVLNYWYARRNDQVTVNPVYFRQLPIFPADADTQAELASLVDQMLAWNAELNALREKDYVIRTRRDGTAEITVPYDVLLSAIQAQNRNFPVLSLFDARAVGLIRIPEQCDVSAQISRVFTPNKFPDTIVLRASQLWLEVADADARRYLRNYLARPQWKGKSWDEISSRALLPEDANAFALFFAEEAHIVGEIQATMERIAATDAEIDRRVLDLYGITDPADRAKILGSAPVTEDADLEANDTIAEERETYDEETDE